MQTQKHEFVRKPRKILSKDKNIHLIEHSAINRQKSRETEQKKNVFENSPNKPHNLISNLRFQLTNLRQEVAKLSKKQNKHSNQASQVKLQYDMRSPKDKRDINSYYFQNKRPHIPSNERNNSRSKLKTFSQTEVSSNQQIKKNEEIQSLKQKIQEFQRKNDILLKNNEDLTAKMKQMAQIFKEQYQSKIYQIQLHRQRSVKLKYQQQTDVTINFQKQAIQNKQLIENLNKKVEILEAQNLKLKGKVQKYQRLQALMVQKQSQIIKRQKTIQKLKSDIEELKQQCESKKSQIDDYMTQIKKINNTINQKVETIAKNYQKISSLQNKNNQLQKNQQLLLKNIHELKETNNKLSQSDNKHEIEIKSKTKYQIDKKKIKSSKNQIKGDSKQLLEIIELQEKSIMNQQSDINYLEGQLRRLSFLKIVNKNQNDIIQGLNEQIVLNNLQQLNKKYSVLFK